MYTAVRTASAQNSLAMSPSLNMALTLSMMVLFIRSAFPFCAGVFGTVVSCRIPHRSRYSRNSVDVYSPPLSLLRIFSLRPVSFSTAAFHFLNTPYTSLLCRRKYTQVILEWLSTNVTKYSLPPRDLLSSFPHTSVCTRFNSPFARLGWLGKGDLCCFPSRQGSHAH